jgi:hypothetical protein
MKIKSILVFSLLFCLVMLSCKKSEDYTSKYEYPTFLNIAGSDAITVGADGFTTKYYTYYLGPSVTLTWSVSSPTDVDVTLTPDNQTEVTLKFKSSAAGGKITVTVNSSNGLTGTKEVTVN